jgi:hypothetical protein
LNDIFSTQRRRPARLKVSSFPLNCKSNTSLSSPLQSCRWPLFSLRESPLKSTASAEVQVKLGADFFLSSNSCHSQIFDENGSPLPNVILHMVVLVCLFCNLNFDCLHITADSCSSAFLNTSTVYVYCSSSNSLHPSSRV